ncbi:Tex family protein [Actinomycetospora callitridis]|uniref:Tex family protein n=1 Tax=Actinomycetospora callitridis TaxID=913944 RepID=UPI0023665AB4|nr:Tex family protein [Actinomycetospora callitridis]MDD7916494.1 Tex family protein [Actinomycetospora callitridis]
MPPVTRRIADELGVAESRVRAAVELLDGGATVPFVARYRKEATDGLDDAQLRTLEERLTYLRELEERRAAVLESVRGQGKLDDELAARILGAETKSRLEDVYLPFKPKRRTKAAIAREAGLEPLADALLTDPTHIPRTAAGAYVDPDHGVPDRDAALDGARAILVERWAEDADLVGELREQMWRRGRLTATYRDGRGGEGDTAAAKFSDYGAFDEKFTRLPSHRILAVLRGETEEVLALSLDPLAADDEETAISDVYLSRIAAAVGVADRGRPADRWLTDAVRWAWRTRILSRLVVDLRVRLREVAEEGAVLVFAGNLRDLLLAAPAGARPTLGLDPGLRTGVKVAVIDGTGKVVATDTIHPHVPRRQWEASRTRLGELAREHGVELVAIGNGTASRETHALVRDLIAREPDLGLTAAVVSEAGASVYSASEQASAELPDLDVSLRGAVSIARRLQDPLAELVKIDPKSIGVGQYQHDIAGTALSRSLDAVVEDAVNAVGVDVNTASAPLLRRVSGISTGLATTIVGYRDEHGPFASRTALREVPRLGAKAFEQSAGFLRISGGPDPLDRSAVHPESYPVVHRIAESTGLDVEGLVGNTALLTSLDPDTFTDERVGRPTVVDILAELDKPGRDPRPEFTTAEFAEGVEAITDLTPGMVLEGQVTNVAAFGAFVDVGVHQDGLVHISAMSRDFVSDPRSVVGPGDVVRVRVLDVDVERKRISLTLRLDEEQPAETGGARPGGAGGGGRGGRGRGGRGRPGAGSATEATPSDATTTPTEGGGERRRRGGRGGRGGGRGQGEPKPAEQTPAAQATAAEAPAEQKPADQKPGDQKPGDQKAADQKAADQKPGERGGRGRRDGGRGQGGPGERGGQGRDDRGKGGDRARGGDRGKPGQGGQGGRDQRGSRDRRPAPTNGAMAEALRRAGYNS